MKIAKIISVIVLLIAGFVSIDLGLNCLALAVPELQDSIAYHSILQRTFGLLEDIGIERATDFFYAFRTSILLTFAILVENIIIIYCFNSKEKAMYPL